MTVNKKVILTGGSGLVGTALQESFKKDDIHCISLVRNNTESDGIKAGTAVRWNPEQPEMSLGDSEALEGCDYAVHLSGANLASHRWTPAYKRTILDSRIDSSRALVNILSHLKSPPRVLVCASAAGFYGDRADEVLTEDSAAGAGFLPDVCKAWEQVPDGAKTLGIRVVHLRFGVILTAKGGALQKMLPVFKAGLGGRLGDGRQWMSWVTLDDVSRAVLFALSTDSLRGACNTVAPNPVTNRDFTVALGRALHRPAPWIVPAFALKAMFGQMAQDALLASTRAVPAKLQAAGFHFQSPELQAALTAIFAATPGK